MPRFGQNELNILRQRIGEGLSDYRLRHILEVERMAVRLGELYLTDESDMLLIRAAALLHDVTKEYGTEEQLALLAQYSECALPEELAAPKTLHARTAALIIPDKYAEFADRTVIDCVRYHTTGRAGMSISEKIIFLADYIDESRTFEDCVRLRGIFWSAHPEEMSRREREEHLDGVIVEALANTLGELTEKRSPIHPATLEAWNSLTAKSARTDGQ